jgi:hypothetical protein
VHEPPRHLLGSVYPVSVDAAALCFRDAAYDALGTETIATIAMTASTLIFEVMRVLPGAASWQRKLPTHAVYPVSREPIVSVQSYSRAAD